MAAPAVRGEAEESPKINTEAIYILHTSIDLNDCSLQHVVLVRSSRAVADDCPGKYRRRTTYNL